jgi:enoyl-CoA hydratase/carnithine racemase
MSRPATTPRANATAPILLRDYRDSIALLTLNHSSARNPLSEAMIEALDAALTEIAADKSVRAVVLTAKGPVFSTGHDVKEMTSHRNDPDRGRAYFDRIFRQSADLMQAVTALPQPVIAAVQGLATAAGCQLAASCDLIVASDTAKFCLPGVDIGLFCSSPVVPVARKVGAGQAMEMLFTGEPITAGRAREIGLVNRVVPAGREVEEALALARTIASKSSFVQRLGKAAFYRQIDMNIADAYRYASDVMVENMLAYDAEEGIDAFIEKRTPKWEDR